LDEEEIEFKRRVEDDDSFLDEEFGFSAKDLDRLSMLDKYRNNLIAGVSSSAVEEEEKDMDDLRI
jgi:hypothetical protein